MLKPSFDIVPDNWSTRETQVASLLLEISKTSFTYLFFDRQSQLLHGLKHFAFDIHSDKSVTDSIQQIIDSDAALQKNIRDAIVIYNYPESNLIPKEIFNVSINKPLDSMVFGNTEKAIVLSERVTGYEIYNTYRIPKEVHSLVQQQFAAGKYWHFYSLLVAGINKEDITSETYLKLIFYSDRFIICVFHHRELYLVNTYPYQTPEDVAFYVLSVIKQTGVSPKNAEVELSGLIDEQSALYSELMKYLMEIRFEKVPAQIETNQLLEYYPSHYFSPLLRTLLCV